MRSDLKAIAEKLKADDDVYELVIGLINELGCEAAVNMAVEDATLSDRMADFYHQFDGMGEDEWRDETHLVDMEYDYIIGNVI